MLIMRQHLNLLSFPPLLLKSPNLILQTLFLYFYHSFDLRYTHYLRYTPKEFGALTLEFRSRILSFII